MKNVSLFIPCFVDQLYTETGHATVSLLEKFGCKINFPTGQTCCGQPAFNSGYFDEAQLLAEKFIKVFAEQEYVVAPSASCVAMVRHQYSKLNIQDEGLIRSYEELKPRIYELSEFLVDVLGVKSVDSSFPHKTAYHASCHGYRELGIFENPMMLLGSVKDIELVELEDRKACCGFGGTFAVKTPEISTAIGEDKLEAITSSGAEVVTATDDSCLMHIAGLAEKKKLPLKFMHYSRILNGEQI